VTSSVASDDIKALGEIFSLLFVPEIGGSEEMTRVISPMTSEDRSGRPAIETIRQCLLFFGERDLGIWECRQENSSKWKRRQFKLASGNLYLYPVDADKARKIFKLEECTIRPTTNQMEEGPQTVIHIQSELQFGCEIRVPSIEGYNALRRDLPLAPLINPPHY
jgi:hypothetical protein